MLQRLYVLPTSTYQWRMVLNFYVYWLSVAWPWKSFGGRYILPHWRQIYAPIEWPGILFVKGFGRCLLSEFVEFLLANKELCHGVASWCFGVPKSLVWSQDAFVGRNLDIGLGLGLVVWNHDCRANMAHPWWNITGGVEVDVMMEASVQFQCSPPGYP